MATTAVFKFDYDGPELMCLAVFLLSTPAAVYFAYVLVLANMLEY